MVKQQRVGLDRADLGRNWRRTEKGEQSKVGERESGIMIAGEDVTG